MGLASALGPGIAGLTPRETVRPADADAVADTVRAANADRQAVVVFGGGTRIDIGDPPERYDLALDLTGVSGVVALEPADLVATVRAGTTLAELEAALAPHGLRWPVEVAHPERATIGGTLASAADGPSRLRWHHPRDWTIGIAAVLGDGTPTRAGGRVVKNVTGYDLTRMYSGSYGTLCVITELTLKLTAAPRVRLTLRFEALDLDHAAREVALLLAKGLPLDALAVVAGPPALALGATTGTGVFARLAGSARVVARLRADVAAELPVEEVADPWSAIAALPADAGASARVTYAPGELEPQPAEGGGLLYPGVETLHVLEVNDAATLARLRFVVEAKGGAVVVERASLEVRRAIGTWGSPRSSAPIARALKERFDPNGVLAPGRVPLG